jgi:PTH1 family peptidyl-tRNA hydrolase
MNISGAAVSGLMRYFKVAPADALIVTDDVNLPLGRLRLRASGTEGGHNGLRSIADHLGSIEYPRLRIGVGRGDARRDLADHVLARFEPEEQPGVEAAIARAADAVEVWLADGLAKAMNTFNRSPVEDGGKTEEENTN